ncbi:protein FAM78B-like [Mytilus californianus]|uniref:protein FAM78B-like n=1 Tax=Mytilus californianus TaxID=6549 RepID=UPI0022481CCC|nr:protein FAM78B-like [Mytilus californianus]
MEGREMGNRSSAWLNETAIGINNLKEIHQKIRVLNLNARIEKQPTVVDETSQSVLKYRTPNFRVSATIELAPMTEQQKWKVGWIQACTDMMFHNTYGDEGYTSWEFPELTSGQQSMISDCDGHHYPWYGSRNETVVFEGPCKMYQSATIAMNDNFHPHVTWRNPSNRNQTEPNLSHIIRDQSFYVWLVAWNMTTQNAYILKTVRWNMKLEINVDPKKALGARAKLVTSVVPKQPTVLENNIPIPRCSLMPPNANSAQMLVWRPRLGEAQCIIPPVWKKEVPVEEQVVRFDSKLCKL